MFRKVQLPEVYAGYVREMRKSCGRKLLSRIHRRTAEPNLSRVGHISKKTSFVRQSRTFQLVLSGASSHSAMFRQPKMGVQVAVTTRPRHRLSYFRTARKFSFRNPAFRVARQVKTYILSIHIFCCMITQR
jgi:hypothetical protein